MSFGDRLHDAVASKESAVCVGLDPRPEWLPPEIVERASSRHSDARAAHAGAFADFCREVIDIVAERVAAVKPQSAFFERLGSAGVAAFEDVCAHARSRGLLVVADVKRGDIGTTAEAYADAWLAPHGDVPPVSDACTVNPYLGSDGLRPFIDTGVEHGGGLFVLVKTSNPSSGEVQDLEHGGTPIYERVAQLVNGLNAPHVGSSGYGPVGAVVGATYPGVLASLRTVLATSFLLVPGYGAQGGGAEDVIGAFDADGSGALITASRSITFPWAKEDGCPRDWRDRVVTATDSMNADIRKVLADRS